MTIEIRAAGEDDFFGWLPLFDEYCRFYDTELDDAKALIVWNWVRDAGHPLDAVLAVDEEGTPVGLAQFRPVPDTLTATTAYFLDDLYVRPDHRESWVGRALIEHVHALASAAGGRVSWVTRPDNEDAIRLYDSLASRSEWVTYEMGA